MSKEPEKLADRLTLQFLNFIDKVYSQTVDRYFYNKVWKHHNIDFNILNHKFNYPSGKFDPDYYRRGRVTLLCSKCTLQCVAEINFHSNEIDYLKVKDYQPSIKLKLTCEEEQIKKLLE